MDWWKIMAKHITEILNNYIIDRTRGVERPVNLLVSENEFQQLYDYMIGREELTGLGQVYADPAIDEVNMMYQGIPVTVCE